MFINFPHLYTFYGFNADHLQGSETKAAFNEINDGDKIITMNSSASDTNAGNAVSADSVDKQLPQK